MTIGGGVRLAKRHSYHAQEIHFEVGIPWLPGRLTLARPRALRSIPQGGVTLLEVGRALPQTSFTPDPRCAQRPLRSGVLVPAAVRPFPARGFPLPATAGRGRELGI